mgnify:FL=1
MGTLSSYRGWGPSSSEPGLPELAPSVDEVHVGVEPLSCHLGRMSKLLRDFGHEGRALLDGLSGECATMVL